MANCENPSRVYHVNNCELEGIRFSSLAGLVWLKPSCSHNIGTCR